MIRWFASGSMPHLVWEWNSETRIARWLNLDGTFADTSGFTLANFANPGDQELAVPPWAKPDLELPEGF